MQELSDRLGGLEVRLDQEYGIALTLESTEWLISRVFNT